ncbi:peptidase M4, partial [Peribacillus sp. NPDC056705]
MLQSETGRYELRVDAYTGGMVSINQLSAAEPGPGTGLEPDPAEGPTEAAPDDPEDPAASDFPTTMITKEQAVKLSLEKVAGTIEDVEYRESKR